MHLNLLIFCIVLSQAIVGSFSSENIDESSDILERKKRVINTEPDGEMLVRAGEYPYVVNIKLLNKIHCVGSILSSFTVITAAFCASQNISRYQVFSGSIHQHRGTAHNVIGKKVRFGNHLSPRASDGIALLTIHPPFMPRYTSIVHLHAGPILAGIPATVVGWGYYYTGFERRSDYPTQLRSITVPIMSHRECVNAYQGVYQINEEDVCIYDSHKHCCLADFGAPLIIDGQLAGVFLMSGESQQHRITPEIFAVLQHSHYRQWIRDNVITN